MIQRCTCVEHGERMPQLWAWPCTGLALCPALVWAPLTLRKPSSSSTSACTGAAGWSATAAPPVAAVAAAAMEGGLTQATDWLRNAVYALAIVCKSAHADHHNAEACLPSHLLFAACVAPPWQPHAGPSKRGPRRCSSCRPVVSIDLCCTQEPIVEPIAHCGSAGSSLSRALAA